MDSNFLLEYGMDIARRILHETNHLPILAFKMDEVGELHPIQLVREGQEDWDYIDQLESYILSEMIAQFLQAGLLIFPVIAGEGDDSFPAIHITLWENISSPREWQIPLQVFLDQEQGIL